MRGHDIFVSYSRDDRSAAQRISARLEQEGFSVWWDAAIHSGESFDEVIEQQLRAAKAAVVLWSPRSVTSRWVRAEATLADRRKIFVPVIIERCDLPIIFELSHSNDLSTWDGDMDAPAWRRLVDDIRHMVGPAEPAVEAHTSGAKGFLLADDVPVVAPSRAASSFLSSTTEPPSLAPAPQADIEPVAETEQTAFYTQTEIDRRIGNGEVHCLEVGPDDAPMARYPIGLLGAKLGRAAPADIILSDKRISRKHCEVEVRDGEVLVTDLMSTNGTFIDGQKIDAPTILPPDSELMVGDVVLTHRVRSLAELS